MVASTRHHRARLLKYYPRPPCAPSFVKSRSFRPLQTHFLLFQQIFFVLVCIHPGTPRVLPRVLASGPKPCGGNKLSCESATRFFVKNKFVMPTAETRMVKSSLNEKTIQLIYSLPFKVTKDTRLAIFQFKIIHHILPISTTHFRDPLA